ncbi:MAG: YggS family pyridoxal phosphate-dependent enzyme, partial [Actinobacteria bacterium]|nr:YggS family pyridoxal phosphate-dependent enzyme [Actinomycetota bacterium]
MMASADAGATGGPDVPARLAAVRERIATAAHAAGRDPADVALVAVSKSHSLSRILSAHGAGQSEFGESRAQELDAKLAQAPPDDVRWHFVGRLQRNKIDQVA